MEIRTTLRLASWVGILVLAACGGGGGGGSVATNVPTPPAPSTPDPAPVTPAPVTPAPVTPAPVTVTIGAPATLSISGISVPAFNFTNNLPAVGTQFNLGRLNMTSTATSVTAGGINDVTATYRGTVSSGGSVIPVFDLSIPSLGVSATNLRGDGTYATQSNGAQVAVVAGLMTYTALGAWSYSPAGVTGGYIGQYVNGAGTPTANLPTVGSATYTGNGANGKVVGAYFVPTGSGTIQGGVISGNVSLNANFAGNTFSGSMTGMTATASVNGSGTTPWNDVSLSGNLHRTGGIPGFSGNTSTSGAPAGAGVAGFSSGAKGGVTGMFYGPNYEEVGAQWTLHESTDGGGKTAFGTFGATR